MSWYSHHPFYSVHWDLSTGSMDGGLGQGLWCFGSPRRSMVKHWAASRSELLFPEILALAKLVFLITLRILDCENGHCWDAPTLKSGFYRLLGWKARRETESFLTHILVATKQIKFTSTALRSKGNRIPEGVLANKGQRLEMHQVIAAVKGM